jgi:hypothetical protein
MRLSARMVNLMPALDGLRLITMILQERDQVLGDFARLRRENHAFGLRTHRVHFQEIIGQVAPGDAVTLSRPTRP